MDCRLFRFVKIVRIFPSSHLSLLVVTPLLFLFRYVHNMSVL